MPSEEYPIVPDDLIVVETACNDTVDPNCDLQVVEYAGGAGTDGAGSFTELDDTPATYIGQAGKVVIVNEEETGLRFDPYVPLPPETPALFRFLYKSTTTNVAPDVPTDNYLNEGWSLTPIGTDDEYRFQWVSFFYEGSLSDGTFADPTLFSNYAMPGLDGADGIVIEFLFRLQADDIQPATPVDATGVNDYIPLGWTDNASGPTDLLAFEFFTKRVKVDGIWMPYDTPSLWALHAADGVDGVDGKDIEFVFQRTTDELAPETPTGLPDTDESFSAGWSDNPTSVDGTNRWQWFSKRLKVAGVWGVYSAPALWSKFSVDGEDGKDGKDIEWLFKIAETEVVPSTPVAPDNVTPDWVDVAGGWTDEPSGVSEVQPFEYASMRRTLADGTWGAFSTPATWAKWSFDGIDGVDGDTNEYIFKKTEAIIRPATPVDVVQETGFVPAGWTDEAVGLTPALPYQWQSTRKKVDGLWSAFSQPILVHMIGEKGDPGAGGKYTEQRWAKNGSTTDAPDLTNTAAYPEGWITAPLSLLFNEYLWMASADKNPDGSLIGTWSEPIRVNGVNGSDGADGKGIEFIFILSATTAAPATPVSVQADDSIPVGWTDNQTGVSPGYPYEFVSNRKKDAGVWTDYSAPVIWAKYSADGIDGIDGKSIEFIFRRTATSATPATPVGTQDDDNVPTNWTDQMTGVVSAYPYEFVSKRTKVDGVWSAFSVPKIWSQMGEKGDTVAGPAIVYRGLYNPASTYEGNLNHIEVVKYNDGVSLKYYMTRTDAGSIVPATYPTAVAKWNPFIGQFENIATGLLFAERAVVENLVVTEVQATTGKIANFTITENKLEGADGGTRITLDTTPANPFIEVQGAKLTRIDSGGVKTTYIEAWQAVVGDADGSGGMFINSANVYYRHGINAQGFAWYGGRDGDYGTTGYAFIQPSALTGPRVVVAELIATELYSSTGTVMTSDENMKKNIVPIPYGLAEVMRFEPKQFIYDFSKSKNPMNRGLVSEKLHLGLLAQKVEQIIPELTSVDAAGEYGMNLTEVIPVLIKAIQELKAIIDTKQDK